MRPYSPLAMMKDIEEAKKRADQKQIEHILATMDCEETKTPIPLQKLFGITDRAETII